MKQAGKKPWRGRGGGKGPWECAGCGTTHPPEKGRKVGIDGKAYCFTSYAPAKARALRDRDK